PAVNAALVSSFDGNLTGKDECLLKVQAVRFRELFVERRRLEQEGGVDARPLAPLPYDAGAHAPPDCGLHGVDQNRLSGPGLTGQHVEARRKLDVDAARQGEILDVKFV